MGKQLSFIVNNMKQGVAYNDIEQNKNVKYKLSICLKAKGAAIALTNYQEIISNETTQKDEEKYDQKKEKKHQNHHQKCQFLQVMINKLQRFGNCQNNWMNKE